MGINEHIYTVKDYMNFDSSFSYKQCGIDPVLEEEVKRQHDKRTGLKKIIFSIITGSKKLLAAYIIYRFSSPVIFTFTK